MRLVSECAVALQGLDTLVAGQSAHLQKLQNGRQCAVQVQGPVSRLDLLTKLGDASVVYYATSTEGICMCSLERCSYHIFGEYIFGV